MNFDPVPRISQFWRELAHLSLKRIHDRRTRRVDSGATQGAHGLSFGSWLSLEANDPEATGRVKRAATQAPTEFPTEPDTAATRVGGYVRLPALSARSPEVLADVAWRLRLFLPGVSQAQFRLEIYDTVFVGRVWAGIAPDLDLTALSGNLLGVSRRHALLQPTERSLDLIDLGSTNGTFVNRKRLHSGVPFQLSGGDMLSFGGLHMLLKIDRRPSGG